LQNPAFCVEGDPAGAETARRWIDAICNRSPRLEAALFEVMGLDYSNLVYAFGNARLAGNERLPAWAECLVNTIHALPQRPPASSPDEDSTEVAVRAFIGAALQLLDWESLTVRFPFLDSQVLVCLARQLATRILLACGATLELENTARSVPVWDFSRSAWLERLCGFAGLNFVLGTAIRQWKQNALEILSRIGQDLPLLKQTLLKGAATGSLVAIEGDLGDRHNDGRSVAVLTFASGQRVVYKPKDSRCGKQLLDLFAHLNSATPSVTLPTQRILCRGGYSWEEYVEQREAKTEAEAARFFRRFGMILRLLQLVEGRDFWIDNLRVNGDLPIFIDFECILHPRLDGVGFQVRTMDLEPDLYEESVLPTAAVTQPIVVPGFGKQDFGSLSSCGPRLLPLGMWSGYRDRRNGNIWLKSGRLYWAPEVAWPQPGGRPANSADYLNDLEEGYREMQGLLCNCAPTALGASSPLAGIGEVPVRVLMRSTWEYLVLLRASLEPSALLDGNARELALANVLSTAHDWGNRDNAKFRFTIAQSELNAIRVLDIPEFYNLPSCSSVTDTSDLKVPDVFLGSAHDRLKRRLAVIKSFDVETHLRILRVAVGSINRRPG
jgi:lantibiotic modifying enzyme